MADQKPLAATTTAPTPTEGQVEQARLDKQSDVTTTAPATPQPAAAGDLPKAGKPAAKAGEVTPPAQPPAKVDEGDKPASRREQSALSAFGYDLNRGRAQIANALPKHVDVDRFIRVAITAVQQNPDLLSANRPSLMNACMLAAQAGLLVDGITGEAYLVPFKGRVSMIPGYRGLLKLARMSGEVSTVSAHVVRDGELFDYRAGDDEKLTHVPNLDSEGNIVAAYAIARFKDGGIQRAVLSRKKIDRARASSAFPNGMLWRDHFDEAAMKTALRRLCKLLPMSAEAEDAIRAAGAVEIGDDDGNGDGAPAAVADAEPAAPRPSRVRRMLDAAASQEPDPSEGQPS